jgi:hypothetical protein
MNGRHVRKARSIPDKAWCLVILCGVSLGIPGALAAQSALTANTLRLDSASSSPPARIQDFAFLTGRWEGPGLGGETDEVWSGPGAGTMTGTFRLIQASKVVFYEFFALEEHEGTVALRLKHFNPGPGLPGWEERDKETSFRLVKVGTDTIWFHGLTYAGSGDELVIHLALRGSDQVLREGVFRMRRVGG